MTNDKTDPNAVAVDETKPGTYFTRISDGRSVSFLHLTNNQLLVVEDDTISLFDHYSDLGIFGPSEAMDRFPFDKELNEDEQIIYILKSVDETGEVNDDSIWFVFLNDDTILSITKTTIRPHSSFASFYKGVDEGRLVRVYGQIKSRRLGIDK